MNATLSHLIAEYQKWTATIKIAWSKQLAYKLNFILLVIGPVLVFFFIRYNLWSAIYKIEGITTLQGYNFEQMLAYQVWVMIVGFLGLGYNGMNLAEDIRLGRISAYLIYPFGFWQFHACGFLAFESIQFLVSALTLGAVAAMHWVQLSPLPLIQGLVFCFCVALFWFQINFMIGILAFWLEETWVLRVMMVTLTQFFSGALIPLELFPDWLRQILNFLPFPYLTWVPVKVFMGQYTGDLTQAFGLILLWAGLAFACSSLLWQRGLKAYTAAGM
ncbi:MAG: ABC-2 family transporter protein [Candidatus Sericytochromatia bacterium]|nr:ABC-2 family transporter protein [Candidatus Sericytochromatia bacterium]